MDATALLRAACLATAPENVAAARADVEPYRGLDTQALWRHLVAFAELERVARGDPAVRRAQVRLRALDDPGAWWERVPEQL